MGLLNRVRVITVYAAFLGQPHIVNAGIAMLETAHNIRRAIGRSTIHDHDFNFSRVFDLRQNALQRLAYKSGAVKRGDANGELDIAHAFTNSIEITPSPGSSLSDENAIKVWLIRYGSRQKRQ